MINGDNDLMGSGQRTYWTDSIHQSQERSYDSFLHLVLSSLTLRAQSVQFINKNDRRLPLNTTKAWQQFNFKIRKKTNKPI